MKCFGLGQSRGWGLIDEMIWMRKRIKYSGQSSDHGGEEQGYTGTTYSHYS